MHTFNQWRAFVYVAGWHLRPEQIAAAKAFFEIPPMRGRTTLLHLLLQGEEGGPIARKPAPAKKAKGGKK